MLFNASKRAMLFGSIVALLVTATACGNSAVAESASIATVSTVAEKKVEPEKFIDVSSAYYDNLKSFFDGQSFKGLVAVNTESWESLDKNSRIQPVS